MFFVSFDKIYDDTTDDQDLHEVWRKMSEDLIMLFGPQGKEFNDFRARWELSLTYYMRGLPRGIYIKSEDDLLMLTLRYPKVVVRKSVNTATIR